MKKTLEYNMRIMAAAIMLLAVMMTMTVKGQTLRGTVHDAVSGLPIESASVMIMGTNLGANTDSKGNYVIRDVPAGRYNIICRLIGYESKQIVEVQIAGTHETVLDIDLRVAYTALNTLKIVATSNKTRPQNVTALAGARTISVNEAQRFSGTVDDIARVVKHYIGVVGSVDNTSLSTHGNPAFATTYHIEDVEVPAPNHFDGTGLYGTGAISALHTSTLNNGDYFSGSAPAEYGDLLGGLMDLNLRYGNRSKYEHSFQISPLGVYLNSEGPFDTVSGSSYLISYRYGLTKLINDLGVGLIEGDQADYHDMIFKLNFPLSKQVTLSMWGLGLWDHGYVVTDAINTGDWTGTLYDHEDWVERTNTVMGGINLYTSLKNYWKLSAAIAAVHRGGQADDGYYLFADDGVTRITMDNSQSVTWGPVVPYVLFDNNTTWLTAKTDIQKQFTPQTLVKFGVSLRHHEYDQTLKRSATIYTGDPLPMAVGEANSEQIDLYALCNYHNDHFAISPGVHVQGWSLSRDWDLQPRLSFEWRIASRQTFSFGIGRVSRIVDWGTLLAAPQNIDLKMIRSFQSVINYGWNIRDNIHLLAEAWFEYQSNVPVSPTGTYCIYNRRLFYTLDTLVSKGHANNYGIAVGVEQFMSNGFYYLLNGSIYRAEYQGVDYIWRPTLFDRRWVFNVVVGKEWKLGNGHLLSVGMSAAYMGSLRYTPVDEAASAASYAAGSPYCVYKEEEAMSGRRKPQLDLNASVGYRIDGRSCSHIFELEYLNIFNTKDAVYDFYNFNKHYVEPIYSCYSIPYISYTIEF